MPSEFSASLKRHFNSIIDRGLLVFGDISNLPSNSNKLTLTAPQICKSSVPTPTFEDSHKFTSELKALQQKVTVLEAKINENTDPFRQTSKGDISRSSTNIENTSKSCMRPRSCLRNEVRKKRGVSGRSEKQFLRLERSVSLMLSKKQSLMEKLQSVGSMIERERNIGERLRKKNERLRKELEKQEEVKRSTEKLQGEYNRLSKVYSKSKAIRMKQCDYIMQLKKQICMLTGDSLE